LIAGRLAAAFFVALAAQAAEIPATVVPSFSSAAPGGALPGGWRVMSLPRRRAAEVSLAQEGNGTVLRVRADDAFGTAAITLDREAGVVSWRWKVDRVLDGARLGTKEGDDFAARVYVSFEIPAEELTLAERARLEFARLLYGDVPSAAICYVWDNRGAKGASMWSPWAERVRIIVLRNAGDAGRWMEEKRDVAADFREAFGRPAPRMSGIAAGSDTDQTHESVTAWFGDFRVDPK
jgi:hypothetical protein